MSARVVPWASAEEWRAVAREVARAIAANARRDARAANESRAFDRALDACASWRVKGRIPCAVDVTATLLSLERDEERGGGDAEAIGHARALALCRLVNGVVDPGQKGRYAAPVATLAMKAKIPRSLVDLRHEATHGTMPSEGALRRGARAALEWCARWYWDEQARAYDESERRIRSCAREMWLCEGWARTLSRRNASGAVSSSSSSEDADADADASAASDAPSDFKGVRERRRAAMGALTSTCPRGSAHVIAEALFSGCLPDEGEVESRRRRWLRVVEDDDDARGEDFEDGVVRESDWRPTLVRLCQKWPNLFALALDDVVQRCLSSGTGVADDFVFELRAALDVAASGEIESSCYQGALNRAMARLGDDACRNASSKSTTKELRKLAGVSKDDASKFAGIHQGGANAASCPDDAAAEIANLRESLRTGRKRRRDSRWSKTEAWTPSPIGVVPGVAVRELAFYDDDASLKIHVCSNGEQNRGIKRVVGLEDTSRMFRELEADAVVVETPNDPRSVDDVSGAITVGGARVELSKDQRKSIAASVSCLL